MKNQMIIVVGPSGAGKSSFVDKVIQDISVLKDTVTYTTRPMRKGESEGNPYHFVDVETFKQHIKDDFFIEWAQVHDNFYGTPYYQIEEAWNEGRVIIMDVDIQGAETFKAKFPQALTIFIKPPSLDALRQRLAKRDQGKTHNFDLRLQNAQKEMDKASEFDHQIINDDFAKSYAEFKKKIEDFLNTH